MHKQILAQRNAIAQDRLNSAALALADGLSLDPSLVDALAAPRRDEPEVQALKQREAIADLLEAALQALAKKRNKKAKTSEAAGAASPDDLSGAAPDEAATADQDELPAPGEAQAADEPAAEIAGDSPFEASGDSDTEIVGDSPFEASGDSDTEIAGDSPYQTGE
jgi:hypothetical protein